MWSNRPNLPTKKPLPATASATSYPPSAKNWCLWWEKNLSPSPSTRQKQRAACTSPIRVQRTSALLLKPCVVLEILFHSTNINTINYLLKISQQIFVQLIQHHLLSFLPTLVSQPPFSCKLSPKFKWDVKFLMFLSLRTHYLHIVADETRQTV